VISFTDSVTNAATRRRYAGKSNTVTPDLSSGHAQPLFEFNPPLLCWVALPFQAIRLGLTDSLQLGLALLFFAGAAAVYRIR
jgi:hypothetical protein